MQILTGILLALVYVPSAGEAYQSLEHLNYVQPLGWYIRALHGFFGNAMVFMLLCHLVQVVIFAAYKYPRELTWVFGCILFLCVLAMAFTGQVLRWDQDAYWGIGIGASMVGRIPLLGPYAVHMMLGGPIIGGETLTRFFALHVFVLPLTIAGTIFIHVMLVLKNGISDPPKAGTLVNPKTEREDYEKRIAGDEGTTFFPTPIARDAIFSGGLVIVVGILAAIFGPTGPNGIPDPTIIDTAPAPDIWFMSIFSSLALLPPSIETFLILTAPVASVISVSGQLLHYCSSLSSWCTAFLLGLGTKRRGLRKCRRGVQMKLHSSTFKAEPPLNLQAQLLSNSNNAEIAMNLEALAVDVVPNSIRLQLEKQPTS